MAHAPVHTLGLYRVQKGGHHLFANVFHGAVCHSGVKVRFLNAGEVVHLFNIMVSLRRLVVGHLVAVFVVALVAVILGRVVGGGEDNAALGAQLPHRKGQAGGGLQLFIKIYLNAVARQHSSRLFGEQVALDPGVIADGHGRVVVFGVQIIGQSLGGTAYGVHIHTVCTGADHASQPGGAELQ